MRSNISKLYAVNFLTGLVFWYAIEKLFMQSIGISPIGIAINASVFYMVVILFDVPSGVLADRWNRKYTMMLSILCLGGGSVLLGASSTFTHYLLGTALWSGYIVLSSGTYQAMMYDSLAEHDDEKHYDKHQGRSFGLFLAGIGVSSLAGGYIAELVSLRSTYFLSAIPALVTLAVIATMKEPAFHKQQIGTKFIAHVKQSAAIILSQRLVLNLAALLVFLGLQRNSINEYSGLYYIALSFSAITMGYVNAGKWLAGALGQVVAPLLGRTRTLLLVPAAFVLFAVFSGIEHSIGIAIFFLISFISSMIENQTEAAIQDQTPSALRATTISAISFTTNVFLIPLGLLFGWLAETYSIYRAYQFFAAIGLIFLLYWLIRGRTFIRDFPVRQHEPASVIESTK
jgi:MFS family permease